MQSHLAGTEIEGLAERVASGKASKEVSLLLSNLVAERDMNHLLNNRLDTANADVARLNRMLGEGMANMERSARDAALRDLEEKLAPERAGRLEAMAAAERAMDARAAAESALQAERDAHAATKAMNADLNAQLALARQAPAMPIDTVLNPPPPTHTNMGPLIVEKIGTDENGRGRKWRITPGAPSVH